MQRYTAPPSHIGARLDPSDDTANDFSYLSTRQSTHGVIATSAAVAASANDSWPSLDSDTSLDTGYGPCTLNDIAGSGQDGTACTSKDVTADVHTDDGGKGFDTRTDVRIASADACRRPAPGGSLGKLSVCYEVLASPIDYTSRATPRSESERGTTCVVWHAGRP